MFALRKIMQLEPADNKNIPYRENVVLHSCSAEKRLVGQTKPIVYLYPRNRTDQSVFFGSK